MKILFSLGREENMQVEEELKAPSIQEDLEKTRHALETAYAGFDNATNPDLIDCYIYEVNSLLKRYTYLSELAKAESQTIPELCPKSPIRALISHVFG